MGALKKVFSSVAGLVAVLAVTIGIIGKVDPMLFMNLPMGFVLWTMTTGQTLPPYFSPTAWHIDEVKTWIKDGDLVISTGAKSGTTWMLWCTHQIRTKGSDDIDFYDVSYSTPWPDLQQKRSHRWNDTKAGWNSHVLSDGRKLQDFWNNKAYPFRIFKSHYCPMDEGNPQDMNHMNAVLPVKLLPKVKFLAMSRNGLDVVASLIPFFNQHSDQFRKYWGGFPPTSGDDMVKGAEDRLKDVLPGGLLEHFYFPYVKAWWQARHEKNVLLLHYSDLKKDHKGSITKIAKFLEVDLTDAELGKVSEKCGLKYMKEHDDLFRYATPLNDEVPQDFRIMEKGSMIRKGKNGEGKATLTDDQKARWEAAEVSEFPDEEMRRWAREGGGYP